MEEAATNRLIFGIVLVGIGVLLFFGTRWNARVAQKVAEWHKTEGDVFTSRIKETDGGEGITNHTAVIRYRYNVGSNEYVSDNVRHSYSSGKSHAESDVSRYQVGSKVVVHYDPEKPSDSVLDPNVTGIIGTTVFGIVFFGIGAALVLFSLTHQ